MIPATLQHLSKNPRQEPIMKKLLLLSALTLAGQAVAATPEYRAIHMEIDVNRPAAQVWAKVGPYCAIADWLNLDCKISSGDGGIGTVRDLANGRIQEIMIAKNDLSYGYTQPAKEGQFYNLYHGYLEAKPVTATTSKLIYTIMLDESDKADQAAKDADLANRRKTFENALQNMKILAEGGKLPPPAARPAGGAGAPAAPAAAPRK
jgi:hypothetical protein